MDSSDERRLRAQNKVIAYLEQMCHQKRIPYQKPLDWNTLPQGVKSIFEPFIEEFSQKPELRMRQTMKDIAARVNLRWTTHSPKHPYGARLDGQLFAGRDCVAVVELEAKNLKQIRGALLDLVTHPASKKILVIGISGGFADTNAAKRHIQERVIPLLVRKLGVKQEIGVFTERELKETPTALALFLGVPAGTEN